MPKQKTRVKGPVIASWVEPEEAELSPLTEFSSDEEDDEPPPAPPPVRAPAPARVAPAPITTRPTRPSTQAATQQSKASRKEETALSAGLKPGRMITYAASTLFQYLEQGLIDIDPEYQRGIVWNETKQINLVNSLYHNYHTPQIVFAVHRSEDGSERRVCIDGKQRLTSLFKFFRGEIPFKDAKMSRKAWFCKSSKEPKRKILQPAMIQNFKNKQICCVEYDDLTLEQERETFQRVQFGVPLAPTDRLPAINGPIADLVRELRHRINTTEGFEGYLEWGRSRGKDFQALAQIMYLAALGTGKKAEPTTARLDSFLNSTPAPSEVARLKETLFQTMDIFCRIAEDEELGEPLTKNLSPLEFVMAAYLIFLQRKALSDTQLSDAITRMRTTAKGASGDFKFNTANFTLVLRFIQKQVPKLIGKLNTDPDDDTPAAKVPFYRVESAQDRFKMSMNVDEERSPSAAPISTAAVGKRKRNVADEDQGVHATDSEPTAPAKKSKKNSATHTTAVVKMKEQSETPALANESLKLASSKLGVRTASTAKTTIKKSPTRLKTTAAPLSSAGPSTTKPKNIMSGNNMYKLDSQIGRLSVRPQSRLERSASSSRSASLAHTARSPSVSTPAFPSANPSFTANKRPLPSRMGHSDNILPPETRLGLGSNTDTLSPLTTPGATPTEVGGGGVVSQLNASMAVLDNFPPLARRDGITSSGQSLATSNVAIATGGGQPGKYGTLKFNKRNSNADASPHDGTSGSNLPHHHQQEKSSPALEHAPPWSKTWHADSILGPTNASVNNQRPSFSNGMQISTQVPNQLGPSSAGPPTATPSFPIASRPTSHSIPLRSTSLMTPSASPSPQILPSGPSWNQRHGIGSSRSAAPPTRDPRRVLSAGVGAANTPAVTLPTAADAAAFFIMRQPPTDGAGSSNESDASDR